MDFSSTKNKALDTSLPINVRRAFVVLCIEASWEGVCVESIVTYFGKKYNLWGLQLTSAQITEMINELSLLRNKSALINHQFKIFCAWKSKKGLSINSINGEPLKNIFDNRIKFIWQSLVA